MPCVRQLPRHPRHDVAAVNAPFTSTCHRRPPQTSCPPSLTAFSSLSPPQCYPDGCPEGQSPYWDDPTQAWQRDGSGPYYATFGSGRADGDDAQALLCTSPDYLHNWTCPGTLWQLNNGTAGAAWPSNSGNVLACPEFYTLPGLEEQQLWVYSAGVGTGRGSGELAQESCKGLAGCYWIGELMWSSPEDAGGIPLPQFAPVDLERYPRPYATGSKNVGKSFWDAATKRRIGWWWMGGDLGADGIGDGPSHLSALCVSVCVHVVCRNN